MKHLVSELTSLNIIKSNGQINSNCARMVQSNENIRVQLFEVIHWISPLQKSAIRITIQSIIQDIYSQPTCVECNEPVSFNLNTNLYNSYCTRLCGTTSSTRTTKIQKSMVEKYGHKHALQCADFMDQKIQTTNDNFGTDHAMQNNACKDKQHNTMMERYRAKTTLQSPQLRLTQQQTMQDRYGSVHALQNPHILTKLIETNNKRFGTDFYRTSLIHPDTINYLNDKDWLIEQHHLLKKPLMRIAEELSVDGTTVKKYITYHNIEQKHYTRVSSAELDLRQWLSDCGISFTVSDKTLIHPLELDLILHEHQLAIEFCGLYWHSDAHDRMTPKYHQHKMLACNKKGYRLITIFEDEWIESKQLVLDKLAHVLGISSKQKIYARRCIVSLVNKVDKKKFLTSNHIQSNGNSSIDLGLYNKENMLIACMSMKKRSVGVYELDRYATSERVVGGFSKLLSYFKCNYNWIQIVSFCDLRWSDGHSYTLCGFINDGNISPDYSYVVRNKRIHKFNFRHKYLKRKIKIYDPNISERANIERNGISKIWDCGKIRFIMNNEVN